MNETFYLEILAHRWQNYLEARGPRWWGLDHWLTPAGGDDLPDFVNHMYWELPEGLRPHLQYAATTKDKLESMVLAWDKLATYGIKCEPEPYIRYGDCS